MKGLRCEIYKGKCETITDCSNGGISSRVNEVILIGDGIRGPFEPDSESPAVEIRSIRVGLGFEHFYAVPIADELRHEGHVGPMFGGCFIYTSDSRFPFDHPIPLHDRWETREQYRALSQ